MDKSDHMTLGQRIAYYRKLRDLTQTQLGDSIGKSQAVISSWEKGAEPGSENIKLLCRTLDISPTDLIGNTSDDLYDVIAEDNALEPDIRPGDMLTVKPLAKEDYKDGDIVLCDTSRKKGILRRCFISGYSLLLLSLNPAIPPIRTDKAHVAFKGKITDIHRKLK